MQIINLNDGTKIGFPQRMEFHYWVDDQPFVHKMEFTKGPATKSIENFGDTASAWRMLTRAMLQRLNKVLSITSSKIVIQAYFNDEMHILGEIQGVDHDATDDEGI